MACLVACGGTDPRIIVGGGIGDGHIDGDLFVHVVDESDVPISNASVTVGRGFLVTDANGFVKFGGLDGPQTIAVNLMGYRSTVWTHVNGTNVTIPIAKASVGTTTLSGTIAGWVPNDVPAGHRKLAVVFPSQLDRTFDNDVLSFPRNGCAPMLPDCSWTLNVQPGIVTLIAAIYDQVEATNMSTIIGWAMKTVIVEAGVSQTGLALPMIDASNLEQVTIEYGVAPAPFVTGDATLGVETGNRQVAHVLLLGKPTTVLVPKPSAIGPTTQFRLTTIASAQDANSIVRSRLAAGRFVASEWLVPTIVTVTRTKASWQRVSGASMYQVSYQDLDIMVFDPTVTSVDVPTLFLPQGTGARFLAVDAEVDVDDFSFEEDKAKFRAFAETYATIN